MKKTVHGDPTHIRKKLTFAGKPLVEMTEEELDAKYPPNYLGGDDPDNLDDPHRGDPVPDVHVSRAKRNGKGRISVGPDDAAPIEDRLAFVEKTIPIAAIAPNPLNPRRVFDADKLRQLGESIKSDGQDTPIGVRPQPGMANHHEPIYQLIFGERRWRAHELVGLTTIRARIYSADDQQAAELCFRENHDREDLNPVEEAMSIDMMIKVGGHTQEQMADRLGVKQETISNKLGVLKLPLAWQDRIIAREITPTHARVLPRWADESQVLAAVDARVKEWQSRNQGYPNWQTFHSFVNDTARVTGRPMTGDYSIRTENGGTRSGKVLFVPTDEERTALRIQKVKDYDIRTGKEVDREFAFNVELWEQLQAAAKKEEKKKQQKKLDKAGVKKLLPRDKRAKEEARHKADSERKQRQEAVAVWMLNNLKARMKALMEKNGIEERFIRILALTDAAPDRSDRFAIAIRKAGGDLVGTRDGVFRDTNYFASLCTIESQANLATYERHAVLGWLGEEETWHRTLPHIIEVATTVGVDPAHFTPAKEFFELLTLDELKAIAKEWKFHGGLWFNIQDRAEMITLLLTPGAPRPLPSMLAKLLPKPPRAKPAKGAKKGGK